MFQAYKFKKRSVPDDEQEKTSFVELLLKFGVSILQYARAYDMEDITL